MADKYIAQGLIRWGPKDAKGKEDVVLFHDGDVVTGPDEDEMKELLEAGAVVKQSDLQRREAPGEASDMEKDHAAALKAKDDRIAELEKRIAELQAPKQATTAQNPSAPKK